MMRAKADVCNWGKYEEIIFRRRLKTRRRSMHVRFAEKLVYATKQYECIMCRGTAVYATAGFMNTV
jgi:hypothetical protein